MTYHAMTTSEGRLCAMLAAYLINGIPKGVLVSVWQVHDRLGPPFTDASSLLHHRTGKSYLPGQGMQDLVDVSDTVLATDGFLQC